MKKQKIIVSAIALISLFSLTACGYNRENQSGKAKTTLKVALVPGTGGVNDRSFNQSAWEGLQDWGKENNLKKGVGYNYYQSNSDSEYITNYNSAKQAGYKLLFGIGYSLQDATTIAAKNNPDSNFVIIDSVITSQKTLRQRHLQIMKQLILLVSQQLRHQKPIKLVSLVEWSQIL